MVDSLMVLSYIGDAQSRGMVQLQQIVGSVGMGRVLLVGIFLGNLLQTLLNSSNIPMWRQGIISIDTVGNKRSCAALCSRCN